MYKKTVAVNSKNKTKTNMHYDLGVQLKSELV